MLTAIVHYNTPKLTAAAIRSLWKHTPGCRVIVFDNSDKRPFCCDKIAAYGEVTVIDNTKGQLVNWEEWLEAFPDREPSPGNNYGSAKHCRSVQWLCDFLDEPFMLMDSDVLVKKDISPFWQHPDCAWVGELGENVRRRFGYSFMKVQPFLCWLNVSLMRRHDIRYFNAEWMWNLTSRKPNHRYDTGAWFCKSVQDAGLPTFELPLTDYILHLGHGSWKERSPMTWLKQHSALWE